MPTRPPVFVPPGHVHYATARERHRAYHYQRPTQAERGYDAAWRKLRNYLVTQWPICCVPGCSAATAEIDHIIPIRERPDLRLDVTNLRPMCRHHHSQRTARDHIARRRSPGGEG